jgi:hypothetical protein
MIYSLPAAPYSIAILKFRIEMAVCKSLKAPVQAIDSGITRGLRAGAEDEDRRV